MNFFINLLSESGDPKDVSTMRLMSLASLLCGMIIGLYGVYKGTDLTGVAAISGVFVTAAFTGKAVQKSMEK